MLPVVEEPVEVLVPFGLLGGHGVRAVQSPAAQVEGRSLGQGRGLDRGAGLLGSRGRLALGGLRPAPSGNHVAGPEAQRGYAGHAQEGPEDYRHHHDRVSHPEGAEHIGLPLGVPAKTDVSVVAQRPTPGRTVGGGGVHPRVAQLLPGGG